MKLSLSTGVLGGSSFGGGNVASKKEQILSFILQRGQAGATLDEVESELGLPHQTVGPRMRELALAAVIICNGAVRATRRGRNALVWVAGNNRQLRFWEEC
jgi:hypothetical protein